jgi:UDPglucose 6-dehydrogenase
MGWFGCGERSRWSAPATSASPRVRAWQRWATTWCAPTSTPGKVARLLAGQVDILEPGLAELVRRGRDAGLLDFVVGATAAVHPDTEVLFLCVPTPMGADGSADLRAVESVLAEVRDVLPEGCVVATKSTVPVGTAERLERVVNAPVVSNPEFLREGSAVDDFLHPDRIVVGSSDRDAARKVGGLYRALGAPTLILDAASAEMVKYASNCFLAVKLSYVNAIAQLCDKVGADIAAAAEGMGHDPRIGRSFLRPGPGWGGSCLPTSSTAYGRRVTAPSAAPGSASWAWRSRRVRTTCATHPRSGSRTCWWPRVPR